jgi:hypothetical protein
LRAKIYSGKQRKAEMYFIKSAQPKILSFKTFAACRSAQARLAAESINIKLKRLLR